MARGGRGRRNAAGGGGRSGGRRGGRKQPTAFEKYGEDDADELLKLNQDHEWSDQAASSQGEDDEDVMALAEDASGDDAEEAQPRGKKKTKNRFLASKCDDEDEDDEDEGDEDEEAIERKLKAEGPITRGWKGEDFYGGEDINDDSDETGSEEEMNLEEARKLEELRALRLKGMDDPFAALIAQAEKVKGEEPPAAAAPGASARAAADIQFETVFAAADAERSSAPRDLAKVPEGKRQSLLKKEAPELLPLLKDFQTKLAELRALAPLLTPKALAQVPASGAAYLETKAMLLLNTLANLSFYLLLRAEGGNVRQHPVVTQLVWLRELHDQLGPLDKRLRPKLLKACKAAAKVCQANGPPSAPAAAVAPPADAGRGDAKAASTESLPPPRRSLRERLAGLRAKMARLEPPPAAAKAGTGDRPSGAPRQDALATDDLLRLPGKKPRKPRGGLHAAAEDVPADLAEVDPTLGAWCPRTTIGEQLTAIQQQLSSRAAAAKAVSADQDVEAHERRARAKPEAPLNEAFADQEDARADGELSRKEKKAAERKKALAAKQFHPEEVLDGRRKTSKKILQNRGLVRQRKREKGNARLANRKKYDKFEKRRKGAVQEMREAAADGATYEGEATGVRTHVRKSMKLG